jgi:hypothetical protein
MGFHEERMCDRRKSSRYGRIKTLRETDMGHNTMPLRQTYQLQAIFNPAGNRLLNQYMLSGLNEIGCDAEMIDRRDCDDGRVKLTQLFAIMSIERNLKFATGFTRPFLIAIYN